MQGSPIVRHTPSATTAAQTLAQERKKKGKSHPHIGSSQRAMQHRQQPTPQAQELHGASRGAGGAASAKAQQARTGAGRTGQRRRARDSPGEEKGRRRKARRHKPATSTHTIRNTTGPRPAPHRQQPPAARHPMAWRLACAQLHIHHSSDFITPPASQPRNPPTSSQPPAQSKHRGRAQRTQRQ